MNCKRYRRQLSPHLDGKLPACEKERLERHLLACPSCRLAWTGLRDLQPLFQEIPAPPAPEYLTGRIMAAARAGGRGAPFFSPSRWIDFWLWPMRAAAGVALLIGVMTGSLLGWQTGQHSPTPPLAVSDQVNIEVLYGLDVLGSLPDGSLEAVMVTMLPGAEPGRR